MFELYNAIEDSILKIEELPMETSEMYDIGMKDTPNTFFANGILVHNSAFLSAPELIEAMFPDSKEEDYPNLTIKIASIVQDYINTSYDTYALEKHNVEDHKWFIKQELVAKRVFWGTAKKRYAMHVVRDGNKEMDKIDIKGFDVVKSDFPKIFRSFLYEIIVSILHDENYTDINNKILNFKDKLTTFGLEEIMKPTSVKLIDKYTDENFQSIKKGAPVHVKSAVNYNRFLKVNNLLKYPLIYGNEKIKWAYLRNNPMGFKTLAMKGYEDPDQVIEYITKYIDIEKMFDSAFKNKLDTIWEDLGWGKIINNKNIIEVFEFN